MPLVGIDISGHQSDATVAEWLPQVDFVIVKATEGKGGTSASWAPRVKLARDAGKLVGHYHYAWPENGGTVDAAHFLAVVGSIPGEVAVLDFEPFGQTSPAESWPQYVTDFADTVLKATGREPWLYSEDYHLGVLEQHATPEQLARIRRMPLWKAGNGNAYVSSPDVSPGNLHGWAALTCWQWTSTPLDRDVFYGTATDWRGEPTPTPTPEEPPVARVTWRGITTDAETALYLTAVAKEVTVMAKAAGVPDWTVTPIPRCGSYQTTTAASAGTHAGGGAVDINAVGLTDRQARVLESAARKCGGTAWFRPALAGVWQKHVHILRSDCADLAYAARQQVKAYRAGYNGLANNGPDTGNRSWVNVTWAQVKAAASAVVNVGSAVVIDAKVKGIQHALRQTVDGKLGPLTYRAVWRLSLASREQRAGFLKLSDADRKQLQRDIGCRWVDGKWSLVGSEMPGRLRDAVGGVQRAMGIPIDRVWTDSVEGVQFKRLYTAAGFKP